VIADITVDDVQEFYWELKEKYTPRVRKCAFAKLSALLENAKLRQIITTSPCKAVRNEGLKPRNQHFTPGEILKLIETAAEI